MSDSRGLNAGFLFFGNSTVDGLNPYIFGCCVFFKV